ncbi:hypothetical protein QZH41_020788 [Actinostola sp. cb2023]|nr:hypothetical protein QZH41_020788 [Actinostola sp. cb2023]
MISDNAAYAMTFYPLDHAYLYSVDCKDFDTRKCQKIVYWLGHDVCKDKTSEYAKSLNRICPKSCGLCGCKDVGIFCTMLSSLCNHANETGKFLQHNCPKTCKTCSKATGADGDHEFAALL